MLVLVVDTLRADRLGVYGAPRNTSPAIDSLAKESVLFERATTSAPRTWQSLGTILTGLYPFHHGVRFIYDKPLSARHETLGSVLGRAGYATAGFGFIEFLRELTGGRSFAYHFDPIGNGSALTDEMVAQRLTGWIADAKNRPFLAVVHFRGPHWPYTPEPDHHDLLYSGSAESHRAIDHTFNSGGYGLARDPQGGFRLSDAETYRRRLFEVDPRPEVRDHMLLHYDAAVLGIDEIIGSLVQGLRRSGVLDRTLVVLTSDHGESFGEHGYLQHGPRVDEPVLHVPLLIRFPSLRAQGRAGKRQPQLVRTVDILPTILDTLGLEIPDGLDGCSLLPAVDSGVQMNLIAYAESGREFMGVDPELGAPGLAGRQRALRDLRFKLVYRPSATGPRYVLYDLANDPKESHDATSLWPDIERALRRSLDAIMASDAGAVRPEQAFSPAQADRLRSLGYVQ